MRARGEHTRAHRHGRVSVPRCLANWPRFAFSPLTGVLVRMAGEQGAEAAASASRGSAAAEQVDKWPADQDDSGEREALSQDSSGGTGRSSEAGATSGSVAQVGSALCWAVDGCLRAPRASLRECPQVCATAASVLYGRAMCGATQGSVSTVCACVCAVRGHEARLVLWRRVRRLTWLPCCFGNPCARAEVGGDRQHGDGAAGRVECRRLRRAPRAPALGRAGRCACCGVLGRGGWWRGQRLTLVVAAAWMRPKP